MSYLQKIDFENQNEKIKDYVVDYWTERAPSFFDLRKSELASSKAKIWRNEITQKIREANLDGKKLNVLDVGCGTGYFEVLLGEYGHNVTGIDLTKEMISNANTMIALYGLGQNGKMTRERFVPSKWMPKF